MPWRRLFTGTHCHLSAPTEIFEGITYGCKRLDTTGEGRAIGKGATGGDASESTTVADAGTLIIFGAANSFLTW